MRKKRTRPVIGFLVSGITDDFTKYICQGALQAAKSLDVDIVVLPGKYLDRDFTGNREIMYEYQHNTIFYYPGKDNLDALLVAADCIGCHTTHERVELLMREYEGIPTVLVASKLEGYVSVTFDNYSGIRKGMEYLIDVLGCSRFGMIGGPEGNFDACERKEIFLKVLKERGLPFREENYVEGNLSRYSREAYCTFLDQNPGVEAVVCVNDETALGFYEELKRRGILPGRDISVLGYDDTINATKVDPSLSSVAADPMELGEQGLKMVLKMLEGEKVESLVLPTKFILRNSFCTVSDENGQGDSAHRITYDADDLFHDIFYRYIHESYGEMLEGLRDSYRKLLEEIAGQFTREEGAAECDRAISYLEQFLGYDAVRYADMGMLLNTFEQVYHRLRKRQMSEDNVQRLSSLFSRIYRRIIRSMDYESGAVLSRNQEENYAMKLFVRDLLQFEKGSDQSYSSLLENLEWFKIRTAFVYTFEKPMIHLDGERFVRPQYMYLKAALQEGKVLAVPAQKQRQGIENLFYNSYMKPDKRYSLTLLPLFSNEVLYGVLLCDLSYPIYENGEFLVNQMSSAVKMIHLLRTNEKIQQQLEDNLVTLRENNIVLDTLSRSDGLTGILNRRGFNDGAERLLSESRASGRKVLVVYVDMNNLKIINDRYGHEEGDFSICLIAETLKKVVGEKGVVGRIGGDEFACLMEYQKEDEGKSVLTQIYDSFDAFNKDSSKRYNITVSAGAVPLSPEQRMSLADALSEADERLYEVKKFRVKEVAKKE